MLITSTRVPLVGTANGIVRFTDAKPLERLAEVNANPGQSPGGYNMGGTRTL